MKAISRSCAAGLVVVLIATSGCQKADQKAEAQSASEASRSGSTEQTPSRPPFVEGRPDKRPLIITATVTKYNEINNLDARLRLAVVRWIKPSTGETVGNVIVCDADRDDCERLEAGRSYTMAWQPRGALYAVYQNQGYDTVLLSTGSYAAWLRGRERTSAQTGGMITAYAVQNLTKSKASNLREWAVSE